MINNIHNRMPVVLNMNEAINYINNSENFLLTNFVSEVEKDLDFFAVSKTVNSPKNNSIDCIQPLI